MCFIQLLMKLFTRITLEDEWNIRAYDYITKAQRVMKIVQGKFRETDDFRLLQHLATYECGIRSEKCGRP